MLIYLHKCLLTRKPQRGLKAHIFNAHDAIWSKNAKLFFALINTTQLLARGCSDKQKQHWGTISLTSAPGGPLP